MPAKKMPIWLIIKNIYLFNIQFKKKSKINHGLIIKQGIGIQVKKTVSRRNDRRPHVSESAPISGALRNDKKPLTPRIRPFIKNLFAGNVFAST